MEGRALKAYLLTVAYNGADFCGWQYQPGLPSVQETLESALEKALGHPVRALGSSRTDAGVHAIGQAVVFRTEQWRARPDRLPFALNIHLPSSVVVRQAIEVPISFHQLRDSIRKQYQYQIYNSRKDDPIGNATHWWVRRRLKVESMRMAAQRLIGTHDFLSFQSAGSPRSSTIRSVYELTIDSRPHLDGQLLTVSIAANGFLYNMVRNIVGTLVQVGVGRETPEWISDVLNSRDRQQAGAAAPAHGLMLVEVNFREAAFESRGVPSSPAASQTANHASNRTDPPLLCE